MVTRSEASNGSGRGTTVGKLERATQRGQFTFRVDEKYVALLRSRCEKRWILCCC